MFVTNRIYASAGVYKTKFIEVIICYNNIPTTNNFIKLL